MKTKIDQMVKTIDAQTRSAAADCSKTLILLGAADSVYLRQIEKAAEKSGIRTIRAFRGTEQRMGAWVERAAFHLGAAYELVWDTEDELSELVFVAYRHRDIDCCVQDGLSCVAEACVRIIDEAARLHGARTVCVIGQGHATAGLTAELQAYRRTVFSCNSETPAEIVQQCCSMADVIVIASKSKAPLMWQGKALVLDVAGRHRGLASLGVPGYIGPGDIGRLNVAILLNRFVCGEDRATIC